MASISVIYHSGYGHTKHQAEAVLAGLMAVPGVTARLVEADGAAKNMSQFDADDCLVFGCPTYMGGPSAQFKAFIDATSKVWFKQGWKDKLAAGFTNSGSPSGDKLSTLNSLLVMAMQHSMIWVGTGFMPGPDKEGGTELELNRLSSFLGAMAQSPQGEAAPMPADLATAKAFGKRIGQATLRWVKGR